MLQKVKNSFSKISTEIGGAFLKLALLRKFVNKLFFFDLCVCKFQKAHEFTGTCILREKHGTEEESMECLLDLNCQRRFAQGSLSCELNKRGIQIKGRAKHTGLLDHA